MPFEPGNKAAVGGRKDKPFRDALRLEIAAAGEDQRALRQVARALLDRASDGEINAIKELADRLDGKVPQALAGIDEHENLAPFEVEAKVDAGQVATILKELLKNV